MKKPEYPSKPVIAYKDFLRYGNSGSPDSVELVFTFTDNEGDIGFGQTDLQGVVQNGNVFCYYQYWDTLINQWSYLDWPPPAPPFDTLLINYTVPPVLKEGEDSEPVKGTIYVKQAPFITVHNKIRYIVHIYDRALHKSDTIHTPAILF